MVRSYQQQYTAATEQTAEGERCLFFRARVNARKRERQNRRGRKKEGKYTHTAGKEKEPSQDSTPEHKLATVSVDRRVSVHRVEAVVDDLVDVAECSAMKRKQLIGARRRGSVQLGAFRLICLPQ